MCIRDSLYAAANYVKTTENLDLIQLNSFGCGLDAVTTDQVKDILANSGKIYTCLKIDEISNLGAARIRVRSLLAAIRAREEKKEERKVIPASFNRVVFTEKMRKDYTILCPQMTPIHFDLIETAFNVSGYRLEVLNRDEREAVNLGLKYVNNDACYPSIIVVGQMCIRDRGTVTLAVMATTGTESMYAVAIPVTRLVAPGPEVAMQTPTFPVALA